MNPKFFYNHQIIYQQITQIKPLLSNTLIYKLKMSLFNECLSKSSHVNQLMNGFFNTFIDMDEYGISCDGLCEEELSIIWCNFYYKQEYRDSMIEHIINRVIVKFIYVCVDFFEFNDENVSYELLNQLWIYALCN